MIYLLPHAIDEMAIQDPQKEAVRIYDESLSYADLVHRSNQLARQLQKQGVNRRDRVGIYLNKCMETAVAIYGIMKAGAAYVPLDPSAPLNRIKYVISDCGIHHLVTNSGKTNDLKDLLAEGSVVDCVIGVKPDDELACRCISWEEVYSANGAEALRINILEQDLAYIMYTSGSTGDPKGIMHTHHSGLSYANWAASAYSLNQDDRLTNHAPLHFDLSTFDFFAGALAGATTLIVPEEYMKLPASYSNLLAKENISVFFTVPFALVQLLLRGTLDKRDLSHLRWIIFGGEPFPTKYLRDLMKKLPTTNFSNMYGPAETNGCTYYNVPPLSDESDEPIPIGQACPNVEALVVDENDEIVAVGEIGELLVRSPTMMQGYWGRSDLNEKAFYYRNVFSNYRDVFYRTGDLVQVDQDGNYRFMGRKDRQVKVRGYRVELDEIEAAIISHPQVEEVAVFTVPDSDGSNQLGAAVIAKDNNPSSISVSDLFSRLRDSIPWYAIPNNIDIKSDFPRTSSGKINRRKLQEQARTERPSSQ